MVEEKGLTEEIVGKIETFVKERGLPMELFSKLKQEGSELLKNNDAELAMNELEIFVQSFGEVPSAMTVIFYLSLARALDYYTGVIFEAVFKSPAQVGQLPLVDVMTFSLGCLGRNRFLQLESA